MYRIILEIYAGPLGYCYEYYHYSPYYRTYDECISKGIQILDEIPYNKYDRKRTYIIEYNGKMTILKYRTL